MVVVRTGQRPDGTPRRARPIKDIVPHAGAYEFEKDGVTTTVQVGCAGTFARPISTFTHSTQAHYQQTWNIRLQLPNIFGVRIGRDAVIPAELCEVVPGQLYRKKIPADMGATFVRFSTQRPDVRMKSIQDAVSGGASRLAQKSDIQRPNSPAEPGIRLQELRLCARGRHGHQPVRAYHRRPAPPRSSHLVWERVGGASLTCTAVLTHTT